MDAMASNYLIFKQKIVGHALCIVVHSWDEIIYMVVGDYNGIRQLPSLREGRESTRTRMSRGMSDCRDCTVVCPGYPTLYIARGVQFPLIRLA
jgi:hypothetical protein